MIQQEKEQKPYPIHQYELVLTFLPSRTVTFEEHSSISRRHSLHRNLNQ